MSIEARRCAAWAVRLLPMLLAMFLLWGPLSARAATEALLMPGKTSLYQRVLTRPGAGLREVPSKLSADSALPPLSLFYVYDREQGTDDEWVQVGTAPKDAEVGWIPARSVIDWRQTLTVAFTRTANRSPALFFDDRDALLNVLESERPAVDGERLVARIESGDIPRGFPVIAREPDTFVDPNKKFYLLPILGHEEAYLANGLRANVLEVAAVTLEAGDEDRLDSSGKTAATQIPKAKDYRAGVVFVIDTTASMGPYIERTREVVHRIYDRLKRSGMGDALSFGLVAFRDNTDVAPGLGYVSRVVATLADGRDESGFFSRVDRVESASASSRGFEEDSLSGVYDAIESIDWQGYDGRFVVLITDAGARDGQDPLSRTRLGPQALRILAQEKDQASGGAKIAIATLHLLTPNGYVGHARAAAQYRELSRWGDAGDLYFPVEGGSVKAFGERADVLADALIDQIRRVREGELITVHEDSGDADDGDDEVRRKAALVGRAMQLAYLGRKTGSRAPRLIDAWVSDRDLADPALKSLQVRVLITKNQLSNLQETLQAIFAAGERTTMSAKDFFDQLRGAAAALARDPDKVNTLEVRRLADVGLVGEWLDDLPYTSQIMNLTELRWLSRSYAEQQEVLDTIEEKIRLYSRIHDDTDRWVDLRVGSSKGESVTTMPLDALP